MQSQNEHPVAGTLPNTNHGTAYCAGGLAAVIVGLLIMGIPFSVFAIYLGREGYKRGAQSFGTIVVFLGTLELIITTLLFLALVAGG